MFSDSTLLEQQNYRRLSRRQSRARLAFVCQAANAIDKPAFVWHLALGRKTANVPFKTIGHLDLWVTQLSPCTLRVAYGLFEEARGQGYMSEVLRGVLKSAQREWGVSGIEASCFLDNESSRRLLERLGFRRVDESEAGGRGVGAYYLDLSRTTRSAKTSSPSRL